jgi:hypothetical protein
VLDRCSAILVTLSKQIKRDSPLRCAELRPSSTSRSASIPRRSSRTARSGQTLGQTGVKEARAGPAPDAVTHRQPQSRVHRVSFSSSRAARRHGNPTSTLGSRYALSQTLTPVSPRSPDVILGATHVAPTLYAAALAAFAGGPSLFRGLTNMTQISEATGRRQRGRLLHALSARRSLSDNTLCPRPPLMLYAHESHRRAQRAQLI